MTKVQKRQRKHSKTFNELKRSKNTKRKSEAVEVVEGQKKIEVKDINHICNELSGGSTTKHLQDWIQYENYPPIALEQAEKVVLTLNLDGKVLVNGDKNKNSVHVERLITLKK